MPSRREPDKHTRHRDQGRERADPPHQEQENLERPALFRHSFHEERGADDSGDEAEREPERQRPADPEWALVIGLIDAVDRAHDCSDAAGDEPDGQQGAEDDQADAAAREDLLDCVVDRVENRRIQARLQRRRDVVRPNITTADGAE